MSKHSLVRLKITVGCRLCAYPSIHFSLDEDTLKITVGCLTSAYPSIHIKTLKITVDCLCKYISKHSHKNLQTCWTPWSTRETRGLWARPPVLTPVPVPVQAIDSRPCLNLHHSDIQSTAQKSPCVNTFEAIAKKKETFLSLSGCLGLVVRTWKHGTTDTCRQCCTWSQSVQDCASFVSSSRNSNRTTLR